MASHWRHNVKDSPGHNTNYAGEGIRGVVTIGTGCHELCGGKIRIAVHLCHVAVGVVAVGYRQRCDGIAAGGTAELTAGDQTRRQAIGKIKPLHHRHHILVIIRIFGEHVINTAGAVVDSQVSQRGVAGGVVLMVERNAAGHVGICGGFSGDAIVGVVGISGGGGGIRHAGQAARGIVRGGAGVGEIPGDVVLFLHRLAVEIVIAVCGLQGIGVDGADEVAVGIVTGGRDGRRETGAGRRQNHGRVESSTASRYQLHDLPVTTKF